MERKNTYRSAADQILGNAGNKAGLRHQARIATREMQSKSKRLYDDAIIRASKYQKKLTEGRGSPETIKTKKQQDAYFKTGMREQHLDEATKRSAVHSVIAQQVHSFMRNQIEEYTGKSKTMGGLGTVSKLGRTVPALAVASIMKPKKVASATPSQSDIDEQKRTLKRIYSQVTKK